jgi:hypothetical protein
MVGGRTDLRGSTVHSRDRCPQVSFRWSAAYDPTRIEHVFDTAHGPDDDRRSAVEDRLRSWLDGRSGGPGLLVDFSPHGRGTAVPIGAGAPQRIGSASSARGVRHDDRVTGEGGVLRA